MISLQPDADLSPQDIAITYLQVAAANHLHLQMQRDASQANRAKAASYARQRGITNQQIADIYGISETAVRAMLKRAERHVKP